MAFCEFCGKEIPDGQKCNCPQALAKEQPSISLDKNNISTNNTSTNDNVQNITSGQVADTASKKTKGLGLIIVAAIILIVAAFVISALPKSYQKPIDSFYNGIIKAKSEDVINAIFDDSMFEEYDIDPDDYYDVLDESLEDVADNLEERYGKRLKVSYTIEKKKEIKKKKLDEYEEKYERYYKLDEDIVKGYELTLNTTIKGKKRDSTKSHTFTVLKFKDFGWKIYTESPSSVGSWF